MTMRYREFFPRSRPRQAKGGIKAQSKRGQFGQSWWAKRWIAVLEGFDIGARLGRGRWYARNGQVLDIRIGKGNVTAKVQGSRPKPYDINIGVAPLSTAQWTKLVEALSGQALYTAKLLAGEMPHDIEDVFTKAKLSLFPERLNDLVTDCSCPDWSNPCKHIAAVYYLIGEEFDRDPFLLFRLRGLDRNELLHRLGAANPAANTTKQSPVATRLEPLPVDPATFWKRGELPYDFHGGATLPRVSAALPKLLGKFPFWRGGVHILDTLESMYRNAAAIGLDLVAGEKRQGQELSGGFPRG
jgi:uncharacterized Zn finger protein